MGGHVQSEEFEADRASRVPWVFVGLGVVFVLVIVGEWVALDLLRPGRNLTTHYAFTFVLNGVPALGIIYGGYWLTRSRLESD
jgi:hypothetical protein